MKAKTIAFILFIILMLAFWWFVDANTDWGLVTGSDWR